jgi:hypothetical protein
MVGSHYLQLAMLTVYNKCMCVRHYTSFVNCCRDNTIEAHEIPALVRDVLIAGSDTVAAAAAVTLMEIGRIDRGSVLHEQLAAEIQALNLDLRPTYSQVSNSYNQSFTTYFIVHIAAWIKRANIYIQQLPAQLLRCSVS